MNPSTHTPDAPHPIHPLAHLEQHAGVALAPGSELGRDERQLRQLRPKHPHDGRHHRLALQVEFPRRQEIFKAAGKCRVVGNCKVREGGVGWMGAE